MQFDIAVGPRWLVCLLPSAYQQTALIEKSFLDKVSEDKRLSLVPRTASVASLAKDGLFHSLLGQVWVCRVKLCKSWKAVGSVKQRAGGLSYGFLQEGGCPTTRGG